MNKLKVILLGSILMLSISMFSQTKESALKDATITSKATLKMDFETVLKHTLPKVLEMMGGKETALKMLQTTFDGMKSEGFEFEKADILNVSDVVEEQGQHRCVVEGYNKMKMNGQRIKSKSYLLGIYNKIDKYWWFVEAKQLKNKAMLDVVLPDFETNLNIPDDDMKMEPIKD